MLIYMCTVLKAYSNKVKFDFLYILQGNRRVVAVTEDWKSYETLCLTAKWKRISAHKINEPQLDRLPCIWSHKVEFGYHLGTQMTSVQ